MTISQKKFRVTGTFIPPGLQQIYDQVEQKVTLYEKGIFTYDVYQMKNAQVALVYTTKTKNDHEVRIFIFDTIEQFMFHMNSISAIKEQEVLDKIKGVVRDEFFVGYVLTKD